ncbi:MULTISPECIES: hypothetical protein [Paenibacillus]|uniref:hypothetical protein n=1 Tax=Paenibacillus TaxID=44249 RepID=UPI00038FF9F9|nr:MULTISPECIES: hypothetical protein [Paenibacillus]KKC49058.1 hypothetical protein VE23_21405 [Paenibacillus sp. D9]CDN45321.1 hypothetical protein BN871_HC_00030 [Paenibacillus sp. P22]
MMMHSRSFYRLFSSVFIVLIMTLFTPTPPLGIHEAAESSSAATVVRSLETGIHTTVRSSASASNEAAAILKTKPMPKTAKIPGAFMLLFLLSSCFPLKASFSPRIERRLLSQKLLPVLKGSMAPSCL